MVSCDGRVQVTMGRDSSLDDVGNGQENSCENLRTKSGDQSSLVYILNNSLKQSFCAFRNALI